MKSKTVKEMMVPVADYAVVQETASLKEALIALENQEKRYKDGPYRHRSLVVIDTNQHVVGRVSQIDIMRAMEPRYKGIGDTSHIGGLAGLTSRMLVTIREEFQLWDRPVSSLIEIIAGLKVVDVMQSPSEGEFVREDDTLNIAMHRIVMGHHHSLLVTRDKVTVGILRSTDVFNALYDMLELSQ
jgi:CBS-domain-containing membrane protein